MGELLESRRASESRSGLAERPDVVGADDLLDDLEAGRPQVVDELCAREHGAHHSQLDTRGREGADEGESPGRTSWSLASLVSPPFCAGSVK